MACDIIEMSIKLLTRHEGELRFEGFDRNLLDLNNHIRNYVIEFISELLGSSMVGFFGCMGLCGKATPSPSYQEGILFGLVFMFSIQICTYTSGGHLNPQITLGALIMGKIDFITFCVYVFAQFLGFIIGVEALILLLPDEYTNGVCVVNPNGKVNYLQAIIIEAFATFVVVLFFGSIADRKNPADDRSASLRFGLTLGALIAICGPYSGGAMNSARGFAPALLQNQWKAQWIYWVGPTAGSVVAAVIHRIILASPTAIFV